MAEYLTERYRTSDREKIFYFIEKFPFAMLVPDSGWSGPGPSYLPLILDRTDESRVALFGHLDSNSPFRWLADGARIRAIFLGPNGYISPNDYASRQFPTWNYAVAEVIGTATLIEDGGRKLAYMVRMVDRLEAADGSGYRLDRSDPAVRSLVSMVTFFTIDLESVTGIFKFSQDKSATDRALARASLVRRLRDRQDRTLPRLGDTSGTDLSTT